LPEEADIAFINLEDNLLSTFEDAFAIASRCPSLQILRLGKNFFNPVISNQLPTLNSLHSLTLTMCRIGDWKIIETLSPSLPNLSELSLAGNPDLLGANQMATPQAFKQLKVLELSNTGVDNWEQVESLLVACPMLSSLTLTKNRIQSICAGSALPKEIVTCLDELVLDSNLINDFNELQTLNSQFPTLKSFGFVQNPCSSGLDRRRLDRAIIPIMRNITTLDGRPITEDIRHEAEQQFLLAALRGCVAKAAAALAPTATTTNNNNNSASDAVSEEGTEPIRIPTLEEFIELDGAKKALDDVLQVDYPHFNAIGQIHGFPPQYQKLV
jgi:hypothetical protein